MKKYIVDIQDRSFLDRNRTNATSKAREDAEAIAIKCGYTPIRLTNHSISSNNTILYRLWYIVQAIMLFVQMPRLLFITNSLVLVQYPFLNYFLFYGLRILKLRNNKIVVLIHDIETLRDSKRKKRDELMYTLSDSIIAHTPEMKRVLINNGCKCNIEVLKFFDYLTDYNAVKTINRSSNEIVYAGNLYKSRFLQHIDNTTFGTNYHFLLYGKMVNGLELPNSINYCGCFSSNEIESVKGDWGLIWDGDSIDTCSGMFGHYLRFNSPFKFSLSLAMGIPVIVWRESSMAQYVNEYHLGICVDNLSEIKKQIESLDENGLKIISDGVRKFSEKVRKGVMLTEVLTKIEKSFFEYEILV